MGKGLDGNWTLADLKKKIGEMTKVHNREKKELEDKIAELESKNAKLSKEVGELRKANTLLSTEEHKIKKVLEYRARKDDTTLIKQKMNKSGMSIEIHEIENICLNIEDLDIDYVEHYKKCLEKFEHDLEINPTILKHKNLETNLFIIDSTKKQIAKLEEMDADIEQISKLYERLDKYTLSNVKILEGGIVTDVEDSKQDNVVNIMMDDYEKQKDKVIKFNIDNIKAI